MDHHVVSKAWFHHPMMLLVVGIPLMAVISGVVFIYLAINHPSDVIKDNYYKDGLAINQFFAEDQQAKMQGVSARVNFDHKLAKIVVYLTAAKQPYIQFSLFHSTDSDLDVVGALANISAQSNGGVYVYQFDKVPTGHWYLEIKGDDGSAENIWRLRSRVVLPMQKPMLLTATVN